MKNFKFVIITLTIVFLVSGFCTIYSVNQYNDYERLAQSATKQSANVLSDYGWGGVYSSNFEKSRDSALKNYEKADKYEKQSIGFGIVCGISFVGIISLRVIQKRKSEI